MARICRIALAAIVALGVGLVSASPVSAKTAASRPGIVTRTDLAVAAAGCSAVALRPRSEASWSIVATNSAACTGPVYNVRVSVKLWQLKAYWYVAGSNAVWWGTVTYSRYGYVDAWMHPLPAGACYNYITEATVTWTYSNGGPGQSTNYSPTVRLTAYGPC
jgi:hypothetical protein